MSRGDPPHSIGPGTLLPTLCVAQAPLTQSHLQATVMQLPNHTWRGMHACSKKQLRSVNLNASHTACTQMHHTSCNCLSNASLQLTWLQQQHQRKNTQHWHAARSYPVNPTPPSTHQPQASLRCSVHSWHAAAVEKNCDWRPHTQLQRLANQLPVSLYAWSAGSADQDGNRRHG